MPARGCGGSRTEGAIYAECGLSLVGSPLEDFLICPPEPIPAALKLTPLGVKIVADPREPGLFHIIDWIGSEHYTNVLDFTEEIRRLGLSRKLSPNLEYSKLSRRSRIILVHARGYLANAAELPAAIWKHYENVGTDANIGDPLFYCPKGLKALHRPCIGTWAETIENGVAPIEFEDGEGKPYTPVSDTAFQNSYDTRDPRLVRCAMPSFEYYARKTPEGFKPEYLPAFIASFPIPNLAVIDGEKADENFGKARAAGIPIERVAE